MSNPSSPISRPRRWRVPLIILALLGVGALAAGAAIWWHNRPIQATVLTPDEKIVREEKLAALQLEEGEPGYTPGAKEIILTERELNSLINENTSLGEQLKLDLAEDAIHARINADIPEDFPVMAGKKLKGKARFLIASDDGSPALILEDLTLWGISLPNAWLGELKGQNLLGAILADNGSSLAGVDDISVGKNTLVIKLAE